MLWGSKREIEATSCGIGGGGGGTLKATGAGGIVLVVAGNCGGSGGGGGGGDGIIDDTIASWGSLVSVFWTFSNFGDSSAILGEGFSVSFDLSVFFDLKHGATIVCLLFGTYDFFSGFFISGSSGTGVASVVPCFYLV